MFQQPTICVDNGLNCISEPKLSWFCSENSFFFMGKEKKESFLQVSIWKRSASRSNLKRGKHSLLCVQKPDQMLAQSSDVYPGKSGGCPPAMNLLNQVPIDNVLRPHTAPVGMMRSNYLLRSCSLAPNSGTPLGTMKQPKGSVSVILQEPWWEFLIFLYLEGVMCCGDIAFSVYAHIM
ncbi:hypothetical protein F0562_034790 [Nyssa sinensis]|uniref:Uncharacterized protein n=1 Tax=Nyssa sinensis TaxID=561372 RepID=A0A5J5A8X1_9ASTE|nr:hypothetical protein F0562_034790 [Nyssa sinensis]